ncbi:MAG: hypothetical protein ACOCTR_02760 [Candidatus Natronoplasma sp.]
MKEKILVLTGIAMLILASIGAFFAVGTFRDLDLLDPEEDALETLNFEGMSNSRNVTLDEGEYEIWTEEEKTVDSLRVTDGKGNSVFERDEGETISIDKPGSPERSYEKIGDLDIDEKENYTFETDERCTLYITEGHDFFDTFRSMIFFILLVAAIIFAAAIGIVLIVIGVSSKNS